MSSLDSSLDEFGDASAFLWRPGCIYLYHHTLKSKCPWWAVKLSQKTQDTQMSCKALLEIWMAAHLLIVPLLTCAVGRVGSDMSSICIWKPAVECIIQEHSCGALSSSLFLFAVVNAWGSLLWCIKGLVRLPLVELAALVAICWHVAHFLFVLTVPFITFTYRLLPVMPQRSFLCCNIGLFTKKKHAYHLVFNSGSKQQAFIILHLTVHNKNTLLHMVSRSMWAQNHEDRE